MRKCIVFILLAMSLTIPFSCQKEENKTVLLFSPEESRTDDSWGPVLKYDSIVVSPNNSDSFQLLQYAEGCIRWRNVFIRKDNNIYERYGVYTTDEIPGKFLSYDSILTFARKDTSFFYKSKMDFLAKGIGCLDYNRNYIIKQLGDGYVTIKDCDDDERIRELYFYDKNYIIYKYILTIRNNMFVYNKKD